MLQSILGASFTEQQLERVVQATMAQYDADGDGSLTVRTVLWRGVRGGWVGWGWGGHGTNSCLRCGPFPNSFRLHKAPQSFLYTHVTHIFHAAFPSHFCLIHSWPSSAS